jgi:tripartite-type tricarboxylate transporter receptor subunit TctC
MRMRLAKWFAAALLSLTAAGVCAQAYPVKPIRFVVTFPPGGSTDLVARALAPRLSERLGQQVIIDNRPGAGGNIGMEIVAKSAPDGHTIGLGAAGALAVNVSLYQNMPFNTEKDLTPVSMVAMIPFFIIAGPALPASSLKDLIELSKAKPGSFALAHGGNGTAMHLTGELFKMMAGIDLVSVPYKGSGPAAADVLGGQVPLAIVDVPSSIANVRAGKLKALAVSSARRISAAPDVPTVAEAGVPGYESIGWFGVVAPAGTPGDIVNRLNAEIVSALALPAIRERVLSFGAEPLTGSPQEFATMIRDETRKWAQVVKAANVRVQ